MREGSKCFKYSPPRSLGYCDVGEQSVFVLYLLYHGPLIHSSLRSPADPALKLKPLGVYIPAAISVYCLVRMLHYPSSKKLELIV